MCVCVIVSASRFSMYQYKDSLVSSSGRSVSAASHHSPAHESRLIDVGIEFATGMGSLTIILARSIHREQKLGSVRGLRRCCGIPLSFRGLARRIEFATGQVGHCEPLIVSSTYESPSRAASECAIIQGLHSKIEFTGSSRLS